MAEFLSDLVFIVELFAVATGFVLLDRAQKGNSGYLKVAGWLLVVGGIGAALCTGYYWFKYNGQGDFERAYPPAMMQNMTGMGMQSGMMQMMHGKRQGMRGQGDQQGMGMQGGMMGGGMMGRQDCPKGTRPEDCPRAGMMRDGQMPMESGDDMQQRQRMMQDGKTRYEQSGVNGVLMPAGRCTAHLTLYPGLGF